MLTKNPVYISDSTHSVKGTPKPSLTSFPLSSLCLRFIFPSLLCPKYVSLQKRTNAITKAAKLFSFSYKQAASYKKGTVFTPISVYIVYIFYICILYIVHDYHRYLNCIFRLQSVDSWCPSLKVSAG